jgi:hypothetical protein
LRICCQDFKFIGHFQKVCLDDTHNKCRLNEEKN